MPNETEVRSSPKIDQGKLSGFISKLESSPRKQRPGILNEARGYLLSHPNLAIEGIDILAKNQESRNAQELLESLQPENITEYLSQNGRTPRKKDFLDIFSFLTGSGHEIAQAMMIGYLQQPTKQLKEAKKDLKKQKKAALKANKIGFGLAEALLDTSDEEIKTQVLTIIDQILTQPDNRENLFIDFLMANSAFAQPITEAAHADEILRYINYLSKQTIGVDIISKFSRFIERFDQPIDLAPGISLILFKPNKEPPLRKVWSNPKEVHHHSFEKITKTLRDQLVKYVVGDSFGDTVVFAIDEPQTTEIGVALMNLSLEDIAQLFKKVPGDYAWKIIPAPQGRMLLVFGKKYEIDPPSPETWMIISDHISPFAKKTDQPGPLLPIKSDELNSILEFLRPPDIDEEKLALGVLQIIKEAQGGLHAISKKGIRSTLNLPREDYLRNLGLNEIFFRQEEDGIKINTSWNNGEFSFFIDRNYEIHGLDKLSESSKNWLLMIVFSYLKAIKNRGEERIVFLNEPPLDEIPELEEDENHRKVDSLRQIARDPFLRVLALGDRSHEVSIPIFEKEVEFHYGIGLSALNAIFLQVQENQSLITDPQSDINKYLDSFPHGQSIRNLIISIFERAKNKISQPRWVSGKLVGEDVLQFRPTKLPTGYNPASDLYMITFVRETELPDAKPREVNCPGVADKILDLTTIH